MHEFPNDGHGLFVWLREYGKLEYDDTTKLELMNEWDEATMAKVGIKFTPNAIWEWLEYVAVSYTHLTLPTKRIV